jgi:hypothetical protein
MGVFALFVKLQHHPKRANVVADPDIAGLNKGIKSVSS